MKCACGSTEFLPLGIQKNLAESSHKKLGKEIYLINCAGCGTTLSCSKTFYAVVKYLAENPDVTPRFERVFEAIK